MVILLSEILYSLSKFLQFSRLECFDEKVRDKDKDDAKDSNCLKIETLGISMICIEIFTCFCTLLSSLLIALKIYDIIKFSSHFFTNLKKSFIVNSILFGIPFLFTSIFGTIQWFHYVPQYTSDTKKNTEFGMCHANCIMSNKLNIVYISFVLLFIIASIVINYLNSSILRKSQLKQKNENEVNDKSVIEISVRIDQVIKKIWMFPLMSTLLWLVCYIDRFIKLTTKIFSVTLNHSDHSTYYRTLGGISAISNGLRGLLFSLLFIYTTSELQVILKRLFFKRSAEQLISEKEISQSDQSFI